MSEAISPSRLGLAALLALTVAGCASRMDGPPPLPTPPPAASPAEVRAALPGAWVINVSDSAEALARAQYQPRMATITRREVGGPATETTAEVAERFDPKAFVEARRFWRSALRQPDLRWRLEFRADGSGDHWAVTTAGQPERAVPFRWRLDGWRLHVEYATDAPFKSFETEMRSARELRYPMQPLGDHVILEPRR